MIELATNAVQALRENEIFRLKHLLRGAGAVTVTASSAEEAVAVTRLAAFEWPNYAVSVDLKSCPSPDTLGEMLAAETVNAIGGVPDLLARPESALSRRESQRLLEARRQVPSLVEHLLGENWLAPVELAAASITALFQSAPGDPPPVAMFLNADALLGRLAQFKETSQMLWALRAAAQREPRMLLVFAGGPATSDLTSVREAAFFGWGSSLELSPLDAASVRAWIQRQLPALASSEVDRCIALTRGDIGALEALIQRLLERGADSASTAGVADLAWDRLLRDRSPAFRRELDALGTLHRAAAGICFALATDEPPYSADGVRHPTDARRALELLRRAGIVESPQAREWRLTDPLFISWLAQAAPSRRRGTRGARGKGMRLRIVTPGAGGGWDVRKPGATRASSHHATQAAAERAAKVAVKNQGGGEVIIHRRDGRIRDRDVVGRDPAPPRD